jgi:DMSO/TMAO reductase YedYZ molybdopterin-dependent catalytic subunit
MSDEPYDVTDIALAGRNRSMPIEMLRYDITPVGMHYMLTHFDIPVIDQAAWHLSVHGLVGRPLRLGLSEVRALSAVTQPVTLECAGNGRTLLDPRPRNQPWGLEAVSTAAWTGAPLRAVLDEAGLESSVSELVFTGADEGTQNGIRHRFARSLTVAYASRPEVLLAYEMNGRPLEPQHGAPLRLIVPGWYGMASVKWLASIEAVAEPFTGYQQVRSYNVRQRPEDPGERVTRIAVRALLVPPGQPVFPTLERLVDAGPVRLEGRAWSGRAPVIRVEVGVDGRWEDAALEDPVGPFAWRAWSFDWYASAGVRTLACRASDAEGHTQPLEQAWNVGGYANNMVQTVTVTVT